MNVNGRISKNSDSDWSSDTTTETQGGPLASFTRSKLSPLILMLLKGKVHIRVRSAYGPVTHL